MDKERAIKDIEQLIKNLEERKPRTVGIKIKDSKRITMYGNIFVNIDTPIDVESSEDIYSIENEFYDNRHKILENLHAIISELDKSTRNPSRLKDILKILNNWGPTIARYVLFILEKSHIFG